MKKNNILLHFHFGCSHATVEKCNWDKWHESHTIFPLCTLPFLPHLFYNPYASQEPSTIEQNLWAWHMFCFCVLPLQAGRTLSRQQSWWHSQSSSHRDGWRPSQSMLCYHKKIRPLWLVNYYHCAYMIIIISLAYPHWYSLLVPCCFPHRRYLTTEVKVKNTSSREPSRPTSLVEGGW